MGDRGEIVEISIKTPIIFNGYLYEKAKIEIDHINYGLDKTTKELKKIKRSSFTLDDVMEFLEVLQDQFFLPKYSDGEREIYAIEVRCPIKEKSFGKLFRFVFSTATQYDKVISTITIFRIRD